MGRRESCRARTASQTGVASLDEGKRRAVLRARPGLVRVRRRGAGTALPASTTLPAGT
jgi:hypothetical protein